MPGTFVSIGNGTQSFKRLLDAVLEISDKLPQPIVIQHGRTPFSDLRTTHFDFVDEVEFRRYLESCDVFITHGGGGSVFTAIRSRKKPVVVPRLRKFDEIVDDHQIYFTKELERQNSVVAVYDIANLKCAVAQALSHPELPDTDNNCKEAVNIVRDAIQALVPHDEGPVLLVAPSGGHLTEIRNLSACFEDRPHHFVINVPIVEDNRMSGRTTVISLSQRDWKFLKNVCEAWTILRRERPVVILTTGGSMSVPFVIIGKLIGIPTIYIETIAKVIVPTLTGRILYPFSKRFFYQWPYLSSYFPKGEYIGIVL